jgi:hypothetical protein
MDRLIGDIADFFQGELLANGIAITGGQVDVAVAAGVVAAGGELQLELEG